MHELDHRLRYLRSSYELIARTLGRNKAIGQNLELVQNAGGQALDAGGFFGGVHIPTLSSQPKIRSSLLLKLQDWQAGTIFSDELSPPRATGRK
jgi:hypothetical protein